MIGSNKNVQRGQATREQIIAVAILADRGYEGTSMEAVLQEAGGEPGLALPPLRQGRRCSRRCWRRSRRALASR